MLTLGLLLVAAAQVELFRRQLKIMSGSLQDTEVAANAAKDSAIAAMVGQRAYVLLGTPATIRANEGTGLHQLYPRPLHFFNFGKTPARIERWIASCRYWKGGLPELMALNEQPRSGTIIEMVNTWLVGDGSQLAVQYVPNTASVEDIDRAANGTGAIILMGILEYRDVFDKLHQTGFAYHLSGALVPDGMGGLRSHVIVEEVPNPNLNYSR